MRIAVVHSFYSSKAPSGENAVVLDQVQALSRAGHEVALVSRYTDVESERFAYDVRTALTVATGMGPDPLKALSQFGPDVVHIHNLFPNYGTRWTLRWSGPIVVSVHNYRLVCANGLLFREGQTCLQCPNDGMRHAIVNACYRNSVAATLPLAVSRKSDRRRLLERADAVVTTSLASDRVLRSVVNLPVKTKLIPNFGAGEAEAPLPMERRNGWLALGRMTEEKGLLKVVGQWPDGVPLTIIGDGPDASAIRSLAEARGFAFMPTISRSELRKRLPTFKGLVFPSLWLGVAPQVVVEAMRVGLPIVAFEANGVADLVRHSGAGETYSDSASLAVALEQVEDDLDRLSRRAVDYYGDVWRPDLWLRSMEALYSELLNKVSG